MCKISTQQIWFLSHSGCSLWVYEPTEERDKKSKLTIFLRYLTYIYFGSQSRHQGDVGEQQFFFLSMKILFFPEIKFGENWSAFACYNLLVEDQGTRLPDYPRVPGHFSGTRNRLLRFSYYPEPTRTRVHYPEGTRRVTERLKGRYFPQKYSLLSAKTCTFPLWIFF